MTEKSETETAAAGLFQTMFRTPGRGVQLSYLTVAYVFGEMSHYLVGVTSRDMAREIHYGDMACYDNDSFSGESNSSIACGDITDSSGCVLSMQGLQFLCTKLRESRLPPYHLSSAAGTNIT